MLFDFVKANLLLISLVKLQKPYSYLIANPHLLIEIYSHTDYMGLINEIMNYQNKGQNLLQII